MTFKKAFCSALTLGLITACGTETTTNLSTVNVPVKESVLEAMSRPEIGGSTYESFKIAPKLPKGEKERKAVKLTYLMNDDDAHQSPWSEKMLAMMQTVPQKSVYNVVFRDGHDQGDSKLYFMQDAGNSSESILAPGVSEVQSNNPRLFSQILGWTLDNYPAKRKYLQIYTHGGGVFGIGTDHNQTDLKGSALPEDQNVWLMKPSKFAESLKQALKGRKLDLIYFRACLMGNTEALYELRGTTDYVLASEDVSYSVENSNLTMTKQFDDLAASDIDPKEMARKLAIAANAKNAGWAQGYTTLAAIDINKMDELKTSINQLALALTADMSKESKAILAAYDAVPTIKGEAVPGVYHEHMRDLWNFTAELDKRVTSSGVKTAVQQVRTNQKSAMIHAKDSLGSSANGLSIFLPARSDLTPDKDMYKFLKGSYAKTRFAQDTAWDDFLTVIAGTVKQ